MIGSILERPAVKTLASIFADAGEELYLVGGCVRDATTGLKPSDIDFTTSARPTKIRSLVDSLGTVWLAGERFGTVGVMVNGEKVEITTFRADKYDGVTRKPEIVFGDNVEEDLARRDFTLNAMAVDAVSGDLIDPFGGETDLRTGLLRAPGDPIVMIREDPLRSLRAIRFAVLRGYDIDTNLRDAIMLTAPRLSIVSQERKTAELIKIATDGEVSIKKAARLSIHLGIYRDLFGELTVTTSTIKELSVFSGDPIAALASSVINNSRSTTNALLEMKFSSAEIVRCGAILDASLGIRNAILVSDQRRLVRKYTDDVLRPAIEIASALDGQKNKATSFELLSNADLIRGPLPVDGYDFMAEGLEGKQIGEALKAVERWYLETLSTNKEVALAVGLEAVREP